MEAFLASHMLFPQLLSAAVTAACDHVQSEPRRASSCDSMTLINWRKVFACHDPLVGNWLTLKKTVDNCFC
jgi:hypothetical protein